MFLSAISRPRRTYILCLLLAALLLAACGQSSTGNGSSAAEVQSIENKGSDTIVNLALAWAEAYQPMHPEVLISVTGGGSGTGLAALINGTVDIANASRQIKDEERALAEANGVNPVEFIVARDAIAVIIHPSNPINELSMAQISAIYSGQFNNWKDVGGEDRPIVRLSRETNSGTHVYFLEEVLRQGDKNDRTLFSMDTLLMPSSEGISAEVRENPNAIGYDGLGYVTEGMKVIGVARSPEGPFVLPSAESVNNGSYPIARDLYMYTIGEPTGHVLAYIEWIYGAEAQDIVIELGFVPNQP
jgi:phosphate transport system substrate-binding protein